MHPGQLYFCEPTIDAREAECARLQTETGAAFVHPYNDPKVMAGQGTIALEFLEQVPSLDCTVVPISGGGMISGIATAAKALKPGLKVRAQGRSQARCLTGGPLSDTCFAFACPTISSPDPAIPHNPPHGHADLCGRARGHQRRSRCVQVQGCWPAGGLPSPHHDCRWAARWAVAGTLLCLTHVSRYPLAGCFCSELI